MIGSPPRKPRPAPENAGRSGNLFAEPPRYSNEQKLAIFRSLFRGRGDVYPVRWESRQRSTSGYMPDCSNKFAPSLCDIRKTKSSSGRSAWFPHLLHPAVDGEAYWSGLELEWVRTGRI